MGMTVSAYCIVGVPVDITDFYHQETVSVHRDCVEEGGGAYCSACGKQRGDTEVVETLVEGFSDPDAPWEGTFRGVKIVRSRWGDDDDRTYLAVHWAQDNTDGYRKDRGPGFIAPFDWEAARQLIRAALEPLGLWREDQFGIHVPAYYS